MKILNNNRVKGFLWVFGGMATVTAGAFILEAGSIYNIDWARLLDVVVIQLIGAVVTQVTKALNASNK